MQAEALAAVRALRDPATDAVQRSGVCLFDESWHQGVVGLVASRVKDRLRRPVDRLRAARDDGARCAARRARCPACTSATCSMPIATRAPGLHREIRRPRDGGRPDARARAARSLRPRLRRGGARAWPRSAGGDAIETDGELCDAGDRAGDSPRRCAPAGRGARRFPEPCSTASSTAQCARRGRASPEMWVEVAAARARASTRSPSTHDEPDAARRRQDACSWSTASTSNEYQGERRLQLLVDHVLPRLEPAASAAAC